ncbi:unnamed protein product [Phytomonas sp. Hart1]|nr:unnamed protein product [Phytomonas sp. Hart1]|eukprot:CCW72246.1 unnamed protein product [Phytomonas sp. isolate Hart1]
MEASEKEVLLNLSDLLSNVLTPNASKLLDQLQEVLFGDIKLDCSDALNRAREVLCDARFHAKTSKVKRSATMRQTEHRLLVLEVVAHLGDVFLSTASGKEPNPKMIKRLDQLLLPQLFLTTSVNSELLCEVALKSPLRILNNASQKDPQVRDIMDKLEATLFSWKTNYGCDFLLPRSTALKSTNKTFGSPFFCEVVDTNAKKDNYPHVRHPVAPCAVWDANSYNCQPAPRSPPHSMRKFPAYLLNKRRHNFLDGRYSNVSSSILSKSIDDPLPLNSKTEFPLSDIPSDSGDSDSLSAFETPVKRKRADSSLFVSPSPDRTYKF